MKFEVWCQTDVGLRRERNEDSFLFDEGLGLFMVADGMGGHRGGEVASALAVETLRDHVRQVLRGNQGRRIQPRAVLTEGYEHATRRIYDQSQQSDSQLQGMGTTLVAALLVDDILFVANVGDSRAYMFKDGLLWQITEDHSLVNEQLRAGIINEKDLSRLAPRNVITRSVGFEPEVQVDVIERRVSPGELFLLCSDGLSGLVTDERIGEICRTHKPSELVSVCINEAKKNGGDDNVTVMVLYAQPH